jgi:hypothetical protein
VYIIIGIKKILKQTEKHLSQSSLDSGLENSGKNHENNNNPPSPSVMILQRGFPENLRLLRAWPRGLPEKSRLLSLAPRAAMADCCAASCAWTSFFYWE